MCSLLLENPRQCGEHSVPSRKERTSLRPVSVRLLPGVKLIFVLEIKFTTLYKVGKCLAAGLHGLPILQFSLTCYSVEASLQTMVYL